MPDDRTQTRIADLEALLNSEDEAPLEVADEIERLRGVIVGCEIAIARDGWPEGAMRLIRQEREAHGY